MGADPSGEPVMHRANLKVDRFDTAEGTLHLGQGSIASHGGRVVEDLGGEGGAHYIYAIRGGFGGNGIGLAQEAETRVDDDEIEVFAYLMLFGHGERDLGGAARWVPLARDGGLDTRQIAFDGVQQFLALVRAFSGQIGITANDQTLAGEVRAADTGHVALVEQRQLQGLALHQLLDRRTAQGGDPVQPGCFDVLCEAGLGDHAAVTDQHDVIEAEALFQLLDLDGECLRITSITIEHLDRDRTAVGRAEQAADDL